MSNSTPTARRDIYRYELHGMKPDVRLRVFDTDEYHVHSVLLKLYSGFFRKFLDSPDKKVPASAEFAYEWVTQIDEDGSWHLVAAQSLPQKTGNLQDKDCQFDQLNTFNRLIHAIYTRRYDILGLDDLSKLVEMADYYCSLRIISRTIEEPIRREGKLFFEELKDNPCKSLAAAIKLRNQTLFEDSLCLSLEKLCRKAQTDIYAMLGRVNQRLLNKLNKLAKDDLSLRDEMLEYSKKASKDVGETMSGAILLPSYYRKLWLFKSSSGKRPYREVISDLLDNDLALARELKPGEGEYEDYFLCSTPSTTDYPWDDEEEDW